MVHLDANFLILALQTETREAGLLRGCLETGEQIAVSAVAWAEFLCGPLLAEDVALARTLFPDVEPLLSVDAEQGA